MHVCSYQFRSLHIINRLFWSNNDYNVIRSSSLHVQLFKSINQIALEILDPPLYTIL